MKNIVTDMVFQFLIGKVQHSTETVEFKYNSENKRFQFLIGKVQRGFYYAPTTAAVRAFQFLIGKVQRSKRENDCDQITFQFLIGKVQQIKCK